MNTEVTLERDGLDQPWGFRLQGGSDVGLPLAVLRVLVGSPADNVLKKGDLIMKIGSTNTQTMTHQKAVDVFECPGNKLILTVRRNGSGSSSAAPTIKASQIVPHLSSAADTLQTQQTILEVASDHQRSRRNSPLLAAAPAPVAAPQPQRVVEPPRPAPIRKPPATQSVGMVTPGVHPHGKTAQPPPPIVLNPNKEFKPEESPTWQVLTEVDPPNPATKKLQEKLNAPKAVDPNMEQHAPVHSDIFVPPKPDPTKPRQMKSPFKEGSPKCTTPLQSLTPRESPSRNNGSSKGDPNLLSAVQKATLESEPSSGRSSKRASPRPDEAVPLYETNSIGGRKRIAQTPTFNRVMQNLVNAVDDDE